MKGKHPPPPPPPIITPPMFGAFASVHGIIIRSSQACSPSPLLGKGSHFHIFCKLMLYLSVNGHLTVWPSYGKCYVSPVLSSPLPSKRAQPQQCTPLSTFLSKRARGIKCFILCKSHSFAHGIYPGILVAWFDASTALWLPLFTWTFMIELVHRSL